MIVAGVNICIAVAGYLMYAPDLRRPVWNTDGSCRFGDAVSSEVRQPIQSTAVSTLMRYFQVSEDLLSIPDYPQFLNKILVSCMAVAPLLKFALTFA